MTNRSVVSNTRRVRLTRSVLLFGGQHCEKGSVQEVEKSLAHDLIGEGSAVPLRRLRLAVAVAVCLALGVGALLWWGMARGWWW